MQRGSKKNTYQFGVRTLLFLLAVTAFSLVIIEHLSTHKNEAIVYSLIVSGVSAIVGTALFCLSIVFAFFIAVTEKDQNRRAENLTQCFHLFLMGLIATGPILLLVALSIFT